MFKKFVFVKLLEKLAFLTIIILLFLILVQVLGRRLLNTLPAWAGEEATLFFIMWLCIAGSAIGAAKRTHLSVDAFVRHLPRYAQNGLKLATHVAVIVFLCMMLWTTSQLAWMNRATFTPRLDLPMLAIQGSIPFGMAVFLYYEIKATVLYLKKKGGNP